MEWRTTTQLLHQLQKTHDDDAWQQISTQLRPVVVHFGQGLGLSPQDAEDAAQETLMTFLKALQAGHYDRQKGRLSHWLLGIARRVILNKRRHASSQGGHADTAFWESLPDDGQADTMWEVQWQQAVLQRCLDQARREFDPKVFKAFQLYALGDVPVQEVGRRLDMTANAVYIAKSRVLARLRELEAQFEDPI
jgi:RNA polymerase sigma-70 factor (ECF subfamily)